MCAPSRALISRRCCPRRGRRAASARSPPIRCCRCAPSSISAARARVADAFTIWIVQWVGHEIRVLDYYESVGQVLAFHVNWLRARGYEKAILYLPHDGVNQNNVTGKTIRGPSARRRLHRRAAGEEPGQGRGDDADRGVAPAGAAALVQRGDHRSRPRRARLLSRAQGRRRATSASAPSTTGRSMPPTRSG